MVCDFKSASDLSLTVTRTHLPQRGMDFHSIFCDELMGRTCSLHNLSSVHFFSMRNVMFMAMAGEVIDAASYRPTVYNKGSNAVQ